MSYNVTTERKNSFTFASKILVYLNGFPLLAFLQKKPFEVESTSRFKSLHSSSKHRNDSLVQSSKFQYSIEQSCQFNAIFNSTFYTYCRMENGLIGLIRDPGYKAETLN